MTILHAKTDPDLLTRLRQMLDSAAHADIAVGYFFMSGFGQVADDLAKLRKTRILIGRADQPTLEAVAAGLRQADALRAQLDTNQAIPRSQRQGIADEAVCGVARSVAAMPQTDASQSAVEKLRQLVASGLMEVRAYPRGFLHAKAYLCWYDNHAEPGAAIIGSSNFTLAGFTGNTELNVRVTGDDEMATLKDWFEDLWADSVDVSKQIQQSLAVSWAVKQYTPYAVYLKVLYELYGQDLGSDEPLPLEPVRGVELANFQLDAVRRGLDMIRSYGGCYVADVVGLGKTYIGAELLRQLRQSYPNDGPPLIICPAGLVDTWRQVNEQYGLGAEVLSQSRIAPPPDLAFDPETEQYEEIAGSANGVYLTDEYRYRGSVLVDEAHNFRNDVNRSRGLRDYLERGDHKVILLSATPQNLGPRDIYRQVRLFLDETDHGLPLEPQGLEAYFNSVVQWQEYGREVDAHKEVYAAHLRSGEDPPVPPKRPDTPPADIAQVLTPIFIRRRRKDIAELYGDTATINGEPVAFPTPKLSNLEYRLDRVYAKAGDFADLLSTLGRHQAVRYSPTEYLKPERKEHRQYAGIFRARGRIAGMIRHLLFKRLESSIPAFRSTLESLARSNRSFKAALETGYVPVGSVATSLLSGQNFNAEEALAILQQEEAKRNGRFHYPASDFDVALWTKDLEADHAVLSDLISRIADIGPQDDDKLARLREFLNGCADEKVLIFSEAETTVDYLFGQLNPEGKDAAIAKLSGGNRDQRAGIVRRFAPRANLQGAEQPQGGDIRLLLATDVVSEGQNMQDCARVLNYDLHWNPVRLIQRFGRVDRIGSPHDEIYLHNMLPDAELDENLGLTGKLSDRIQQFHDLIGLDNKVLSEEEQLNARGVGVIYDNKELPELGDALDEVSANQRAIALLQNIRSNDPDLWRKITELPDGIRSALRGTKNGDGDDAPQAGETVVMLAASDAVRCYTVGDDLTPRPIQPGQLVAAVECEPDTPAEPLPDNTNARVSAAAEAFSGDLSRMLGTVRRRTPGNARNRTFVSRQLNGIGTDLSTPQRIETLRRTFAGDLPTVVENELSDLRQINLGGRELMLRLELLQERYRLNPAAQSVAPAASEPTRVACSMGLVANEKCRVNRKNTAEDKTAVHPDQGNGRMSPDTAGLDIEIRHLATAGLTDLEISEMLGVKEGQVSRVLNPDHCHRGRDRESASVETSNRSKPTTLVNPLGPKWIRLTQCRGTANAVSPASIRFPDGTTRSINKWNGILKETAEWLYDNNLLNRGNTPVISGPSGYLVSSQPKHQNGRAFGSKYKMTNGFLYVNTQYNIPNIPRMTVKLLEHCGVDPRYVTVHSERLSETVANGDEPEPATGNSTVEDGWTPLPRCKVTPGTGDTEAIRFPDGTTENLDSWRSLLRTVGVWLNSKGLLTAANLPVPSGPKRHLANTQPTHPTGKEFRHPVVLPNGPVHLEQHATGKQVKSQALKLLNHCGVKPQSVEIYQTAA